MESTVKVKGSATSDSGQVSTVRCAFISGFGLGFVGACPMRCGPAIALIATMKGFVVAFDGPVS